MQPKSAEKFVGYIGIVGRPNVGKSTLLNTLLNRKISITSKRAQTTRNRILGIKTQGAHQFIYVDTPGIHRHQSNKLNSFMNKTALNTLTDVDVLIMVVAGTLWLPADEEILLALKSTNLPILLVINKVDLVAQKELLLAQIDKLQQKHPFAAIIPCSAKQETNITPIETALKKLLPNGEFLFPTEQHTDHSYAFWIAELIREKLTRLLGDELPYSISVVVEKLEDRGQLLFIGATIYVERKGQRIIIIGTNGENLKKIGTLTRKEIEQEAGKKVFLQLWVKVKSNWTQDNQALKFFGYEL